MRALVLGSIVFALLMAGLSYWTNAALTKVVLSAVAGGLVAVLVHLSIVSRLRLEYIQEKKLRADYQMITAQMEKLTLEIDQLRQDRERRVVEPGETDETGAGFRRRSGSRRTYAVTSRLAVADPTRLV